MTKMRFRWLVVSAIAFAALGSLAGFTQGADAGLFTPLGPMDAAHLGHPPVAPGLRAANNSGTRASPNAWLVRVDRQRLFQTIHSVARTGSGHLLLNVAEELEFEVEVERTRRTLSGHSLSGRVRGLAGSAVTFAVNAQTVVGTVWTPSAAYELAPINDGVHAFREVNWLARPPLGAPISVEGGRGETHPLRQVDADDGGNVVDVLVLWTPRAQENIGGEGRMRATVDHAEAWANDAYKRSGADVRLNLVGAEPIDYIEAVKASTADLNRLRFGEKGLEAAHVRRDALGADLVSLFTGDGDTGGIAYTNQFPSVIVVRPDVYTGWLYSTFTHELGHNMGLSHDRYADLSVGQRGLLPFSYGYVNKLAFEHGASDDACWGTIMAYARRCVDRELDYREVPYFSTPLRRYPDSEEGVPLGVPKSSDELGADGPADAVRTLNLTSPRIAGFRSAGRDEGNTPDAANPVVATSNTFGTFAAGGDDIDYFRVELPEAGRLRVEITAGQVEVTGEGGEERGPVGAEVDAMLEAGVHFIRATGGARSKTVEYELVLKFTPTSVDDHDNQASQATAASLPSSTVGELQYPSDTDYFRFEVAERGIVRVETTGQTDVKGTLRSEDGTVMLTDDDGGSTVNFRLLAKLDPGTYFVEVGGFEVSTTGSYSLHLSLSTESDDHADFPGNATPLDVGASASGQLEVAFDRDLFRIEVLGASPGLLWVKATDKNARIAGALFSESGELVRDAFFGNPVRDGKVVSGFVLGEHVPVGTFVLHVWDLDATVGGAYDLEVSFTADNYSMPLFVSAANPKQQGFARIVNRDNRAGTVTIHAIDDAGQRRGPVNLSLSARQTAHFNAHDLEMGNATKGLSSGVGRGDGDWRLDLTTELDIEPLAYVRTADGFVSSMHDASTSESPNQTCSVYQSRIWSCPNARSRLPMFNPASNHRQVSKLRLTNPGPGYLSASLRGIDDSGAVSDFVYLGVYPSVSRTITAQTLEAGGDGSDDVYDSLGDGGGKWRLDVLTSYPVRVMSLLENPAGHLTNLTRSTAPIGREVSLPLFLSAANVKQQSFARVIDRGGGGEVTIHGIDDAGRRSGPVTLSLKKGHVMHFNSDDLEMGNPEKGLSGSLGAGTGDWRLEFTADMDIEALAYVRTSDGFLTGMNAVAPRRNGRHEVVFFNPASNDRQVSTLRLVNPTAASAAISISGLDDAGAAPPAGDIKLTLPAGTATAISGQQLEAGAAHFDGRFGDGTGKWQLFIEADQDIQAMSLLESPTGHISNLSAGTAVR